MFISNGLVVWVRMLLCSGVWECTGVRMYIYVYVGIFSNILIFYEY